uniref:uncharacterized protein LOC117602908 isoform X3 n=1 Tax=Osmia lignaria TaxID=473952 RepID=UPI001478F33B|nr:uncharacterized protein LOC117602908 isoform X3 [Osmia lignaria]
MQLTQRETVWLEEKSTLQHGFQGTWTSSGTREESRSIVDTKSCDARHNNFRREKVTRATRKLNLVNFAVACK